MTDEKKIDVDETEPTTLEAISELSKSKEEIEGITGKNIGVIYDITGKEYKYSPVPIAKYPEMQELLNLLSDTERAMKEIMTGGDSAAKIILMGLEPNYPDMKIDQVKKLFDLSAYPRAMKLALNLNSFFAELREIQAMTGSMGMTN